MKRLFTSIGIWLFAAILAKAGPVSLSQARSFAQKALEDNNLARGKNASANQQSLKLAFTQTANKVIAGIKDYPLYYAFNKADDKGFIIVSGDDNAKPILGICDNGHFDANTSVPGMRWWLEAISASVQRIAENENSTTDDTADEVQAVEPLIKTRWSQGAPYNNACPIDTFCQGKQVSVTGCVATALAQIFNYWKYPKQVTGTVSYRVNNNHPEPVPNKNFPTVITYKFDLAEYPFDYAQMRQRYQYNYTEKEAQNVANLMLVCGAAMSMDYCQAYSGSNIDREVLVNTFGYDKACRSISRNSFSAREWLETIYHELQAGRPVLYQGQSGAGGHQFICDGIDEDGRLHFNWGWGSLNDGYYDVTCIDYRKLQGYAFNQVATIGLQPEQGGEGLHVSNNLQFSKLNVTVKQSSLSASLQRLGAMESPVETHVGYMLYDSEGNVIDKHCYDNEINLEPGMYFDTYTFASINFNKKYSDGTYYLVPAAGASYTDLQPITNGSSKTYKDYIVINLQNGQLSAKTANTLTKDEFGITIGKNLTPADGGNMIYAYYNNDITFDITNSGKNFDGILELIYKTKIPVVDNDEQEGKEPQEVEKEFVKASCNINIEKGETQTINQTILADEGDNTLEVWAYQDNSGEKLKIGELTYTGKQTTAENFDPQIENVEILTPTITLDQDLKFKVTINNIGGFFQGSIPCYIEIPQGGGYVYSSQNTKVISIDQERKTFTFSLPTHSVFDYLGITSGKGYLQVFNDRKLYEFTVIDSATGISGVPYAPITSKDMIYTLKGEPCGHNLQALPNGVYIQNGKKIIK